MSTTTTEAPSTRVHTRGVLDRAAFDRAALDRAVVAMSTRRRADVDVLESALAWAHANVPSDDDDIAGWSSDATPTPGSYAAAMFGERTIPVAGVGTPEVADSR